MANNNKYTRVTRRQKKKKGNRAIVWLAGIASVMILVLIAFFMINLGNGSDTADEEGDNSITLKEPYKNDNEDAANDETSKDEESENEKSEKEADESSEEEQDNDQSSDSDSKNEEESSSEKESSKENESSEEDTDTKEKDKESEEETVEDSDKPNVEKVITKNWSPVPTKQNNHTRVTFNEGSQDWKEMTAAIAKGAGLSQDDMIVWWVDGNGQNSVVGTVTNKDQTDNYRVYVSWVDGAGYKPTKVEVLQKNDKK